ncbi:bifunctional 2-polyprenyl-6-hydroxyphenol methylase/3-demethylubiquinol 3-O-methyltransferase UbiG [Brevibacterium aurantiacum]|uniref:class I SAM-dependent methyltransferase n=1 Tax=Brevibacterium aurantiacum TaxID=273384 RepID=UPI0016427FD4|nr:methyltransferase [Brevibacterium aurantiacum]
MKSDEFYDQLSSDYASFNGVSRHYLAAVDRAATHHIDGAKSWLDIGTGDGLRAASLLDALRSRPQEVTLCDSSAGMVAAAKRNLPQERVTQWGMTKQTPFPPGQTFAVITLLGNVLGHVHPKEFRLEQLAAIRPLLADNGTLLLDFNNRWNTRAYGMRRAGTNILRDLIRRPHSTFTATKCINGESISTPVYLGSPREYRLLLSKAGFHIHNVTYHHYTTGEHANPLTGQGLIQATKKEKS